MAWLNDVMGGLNTALGGQGDAIGKILNLFGPKMATNKYNVPTHAEKSANALFQALLNPNSPTMTGLTGHLRDQNLEDFQTQLREMQLGDRREMAMGRAPTFFQPERADEAISFLTSRGLPQLNNMAQQSAAQRILEAAGGISNFMMPQFLRQLKSGNDLINTMGIPGKIFEEYNQGGFSQTPMKTMQSNPRDQFTYYPGSGVKVDWR